MAKLLDEIKWRIADWDKYKINVTKDYNQWVQFSRKHDMPDGFSLCTIDWQTGPDNMDNVTLTLETHIKGKIDNEVGYRQYSCSETHKKSEYMDHVVAPISVKYHVVNYIINKNEVKAYGP